MKSDFTRLKQKIMLQVISVGIVGLILAYLANRFLIDGIFQDPFARLFMKLCAMINLNESTSQTIYWYLIQGHKSTWLLIGLILLLLILFYFSLSLFTRHFDQIQHAVDQLATESEQQIILPAELEFMERKLNSVRETLSKRSRDALDAEQRKNDLVVYLAHDLKTPLTSVVGYLSLLTEAADMPVEQRTKYTGIALDKAYRLEQLIDEFFDITRFNLQSIVLNREMINLTYMLEQLSDEFYPVLEARQIQISIHSPEDLTVYADPDKLARVFNNILKNAAAYGSAHSKIEIQAQQSDRFTLVTFSNEGKTIPSQQLNMIFEKFYRLDQARGSHSGGAGLGLAIAKEIVTAHGGTITAQSENAHTIFSVCLPPPESSHMKN